MTDHNSPLTLIHCHGSVSPVETLGGILGADTATCAAVGWWRNTPYTTCIIHTSTILSLRSDLYDDESSRLKLLLLQTVIINETFSAVSNSTCENRIDKGIFRQIDSL